MRLCFGVCLKLGTAYRLAEGADMGHKLIHIVKTIGPAFRSFAPGLNSQDWLVGLIGAVIIRLVVYVKSKNAKKFRKDVEYGSARWGTAKDIKPFIDPVSKQRHSHQDGISDDQHPAQKPGQRP